MRALIFLLGIALSLFPAKASASVVIPPMPSTSPTVHIDDDAEWAEYHSEAKAEYANEFTALLNSYETKWSKNGRLMIRQGNSGSFKFAKK